MSWLDGSRGIHARPGSGGGRARSSMRPTHPRVTVVVPARNEAANLRIVLPTIPDVHQVILVDGRSTDGTVEVARETRPKIDVVHQTRRGKGNALVAGFGAATGDVIVMFDADGSADAREIQSYVDALTQGADFAKGSRYLAGGGSQDITRLRTVGNSLLSSTANAVFGTRYTDLCYGFNAFWVDILPLLRLPDPHRGGPHTAVWGDGFEIETLINTRVAALGLSVQEVPSFERSRIHGTSQLRTFRDGFRVLRTIAVERRQTPRQRPASALMAGTSRSDPTVPAPRQPEINLRDIDLRAARASGSSEGQGSWPRTA